MAIPQWKLNLQPATFNGALFFIDVNTRASGRRIANHEYPKRDTPYAEDMGRKSRKFPVTGYVIGPDYTDQRDVLIEQLELEGPGQLVLPTGLEVIGTGLVTVENYSVTERRERGGIATFEMTFLEFGVNTSTINNTDTQSQTATAANAATADTSLTTQSPIQFTGITGNNADITLNPNNSFGLPSFMQSSDFGTFAP